MYMHTDPAGTPPDRGRNALQWTETKANPAPHAKCLRRIRGFPQSYALAPHHEPKWRDKRRVTPP